ncbi:MAG: carboxypeptidase regulatory-like domain-containing protein [Solirubrobacterales bacterium]|nr:carboxypeptidase regulatory-like domain-containing protein [Solirubrobacterales bacterium]
MLALTAGIVLLAFAPAGAGAAGTGSISGTLTSANHVAAGVCVEALDADGETVRSAISGADGKYTLAALDTGSYRVQFFTGNVEVGYSSCVNANVLGEYYDDKASLAAATPVSVTDGSDTPGIDAQLAKGGSISGRVKVGTNGPDGGICVAAYDSSGRQVKWVAAGSNGGYAISGLTTGDYRLNFFSCDPRGNALSEFYPDKEDLDDATPISVTAGSDTPGIDAHMTLGGSISGTVKSGANDDFGGTCVMDIKVYDSKGKVAATDSGWWLETYKFTKLEPGEYRLRFDVSCVGPPMLGEPPSHRGEYFNDKQGLAEATPVTVGEGADVTGINVLLGADGTISGTVTDAKGTPLDDVCVEAFDSNGEPAGVVAHSTAAGRYVVKALDSGSYRLKFSDCVNPGDPSVTTEFYDDKATLEDAVPVSVTRGTDTPGVDAQLAVKPRAAISKVTVKGPAKAKKGRKVIQKVAITNSGNVAATGVALKVSGRGVRFRASVGSIPAGATRVVKAKLRPKRPGKAKLTFKVTSSNAGGKSATRVIVVKRTKSRSH